MLWWLLVIPHPVCHEWADAILHAQRKAAEVWTHWSQSFCCGRSTPQGESLELLGTLIWYTSMRANTPLIINGAPSLQKGPWSHVHHTSFPDPCFLTILRTLSTAWHASDFVPHPASWNNDLDSLYLPCMWLMQC